MPTTGLPRETLDALLDRYQTFRHQLWTILHEHRLSIENIVKQADDTAAEEIKQNLPGT